MRMIGSLIPGATTAAMASHHPPHHARGRVLPAPPPELAQPRPATPETQRHTAEQVTVLLASPQLRQIYRDSLAAIQAERAVASGRAAVAPKCAPLAGASTEKGARSPRQSLVDITNQAASPVRSPGSPPASKHKAPSSAVGVPARRRPTMGLVWGAQGRVAALRAAGRVADVTAIDAGASAPAPLPPPGDQEQAAALAQPLLPFARSSYR